MTPARLRSTLAVGGAYAFIAGMVGTILFVPFPHKLFVAYAMLGAWVVLHSKIRCRTCGYHLGDLPIEFGQKRVGRLSSPFMSRTCHGCGNLVLDDPKTAFERDGSNQPSQPEEQSTPR